MACSHLKFASFLINNYLFIVNKATKQQIQGDVKVLEEPPSGLVRVLHEDVSGMGMKRLIRV